MNKFTKWLFQHKKRKYKVVYIAYGFMGNRWNVATFEFSVSDNTLKKMKFTPQVYGFYININKLEPYFSNTFSYKILSQSKG